MAARRRGSFNASYPGIGEMLRSEFLQDEMLERADAVKAYAESISPRETGEYASSFYSYVRKYGGYGHNRAMGVVGNDDPHALEIEVGTKRTRAQRILRRALTEAQVERDNIREFGR